MVGKMNSSPGKRRRLYEDPTLGDKSEKKPVSKAASKPSSSQEKKHKKRVPSKNSPKISSSPGMKKKPKSIPEDKQKFATETTTPPPAPDDIEMIDRQRIEQANLIIKKYTRWSTGIAVVPIPVLDLAGLITSQTSMIAELTAVYDVPFGKEIKKSLFSVITTGLFSYSVSSLPVLSLSKIVPGLGLIWSTISYPVAAGASTYAVGKVFMLHFESGGTLLDFDPAKMKSYYRETYRKGIKQAKAL